MVPKSQILATGITKEPRTTCKRRQDLLQMPLDILFEVFGHLLPLDALNLARTPKALRNVVMHRSAVSIWKAAFSNLSVSLPCPIIFCVSSWQSTYGNVSHVANSSHIRVL